MLVDYLKATETQRVPRSTVCCATILRGVLPIFVAVIFAGCSFDYGENDHFDAREPGRLVEWVKKYHSRGFSEEITFVDGVLSMQCDEKADIDLIYDAGNRTYEILKAYTKAASNQDALMTVSA